MRKVIIFCSLVMVTTASYAQEVDRGIQKATDSISMKKAFGGYQFYQGDKKLNMKQLVALMEPDKQAYKMIKSAQSNNTIATILGYAGGFMVGYPLGTSLAGGKPNWTVAGIGAGLIVVAIPISLKTSKQAKQAVNTYNSGLQSVSSWDKNELRFIIKENRAGLALYL